MLVGILGKTFVCNIEAGFLALITLLFQCFFHLCDFLAFVISVIHLFSFSVFKNKKSSLLLDSFQLRSEENTCQCRGSKAVFM